MVMFIWFILIEWFMVYCALLCLIDLVTYIMMGLMKYISLATFSYSYTGAVKID